MNHKALARMLNDPSFPHHATKHIIRQVPSRAMSSARARRTFVLRTARPLHLPKSPFHTEICLVSRRPFPIYTKLLSPTRTMHTLSEGRRYPHVRHSFQGADAYLNAGPDPYNYTSGRWLRHDELERKSRFIQFDFDALCRRVVALCPGAQSITSYEKKEGGNNRVFIFHTDNAKCLVARLPFSQAGPPRYTTGSEVATIQYRTSLHDR